MKTAEQIAQAALNAVERKFIKSRKEDFVPAVPQGFRSLDEWQKLLGYNREYARKVLNTKHEKGEADKQVIIGRRNGTNFRLPCYRITK